MVDLEKIQVPPKSGSWKCAQLFKFWQHRISSVEDFKVDRKYLEKSELMGFVERKSDTLASVAQWID